MSDRNTHGLMQIGDVSARTGLSLRTIRYYEEAGLLEPCERSAGGFRLYSHDECETLELIKKLKTIGFSLEEMRELLDLLQNAGERPGSPELKSALLPFLDSVDAHCLVLESQLAETEAFAESLREIVDPTRAGVGARDER